MRVLHLVNGEHFSGAERVQQLLGKRLPELGVDARFVCLKRGKFVEHCGLESERVEVIPMSNRFDLSVVRRIEQYAKHEGFDLIHAHTPRTAMIANLMSRATRIPWIYHVHSPTAQDSTRSIINQVNDWVESLALRTVSHIVTVSKSLRRTMLSRGYRRQQLSTIANGVAFQEPIDALARKNREQWKLGMVALVRPRKGIEVLLEAIHRLNVAGPRITLDVIGGFETVEYETKIRGLIDSLGLRSQVFLRGFTDNVPAALRQLDGMVLPSLFGEGMPMVVLEALALGVPVIATRVEGTPEVVRDGREGVLAEPRDPQSLAAAIERFVQNRSDWCLMSTRAWARHRELYSDVRMANATAKLYRSILDRRVGILPAIFAAP